MKNFNVSCTLNSFRYFYEQARYLSPTFLSKVRMKKNVWIPLEVYIISPCKIAQPLTLFLLIYSNLPKMFQKGAFLNCPAPVTIQWLKKSNSKKFVLIKAILTYIEKRHFTSCSFWRDFGQGSRRWWEGRAFHVWAESPLPRWPVQGYEHWISYPRIWYSSDVDFLLLLYLALGDASNVRARLMKGQESMAGICVNHHRYGIQHEEKARFSPLLLNEMDYTDITKLGKKGFVQSLTEDNLWCTS